MSRRGNAVGFDLPPGLAKLAEEVAVEIAKERGGMRRAAFVAEFMSAVWTGIIERVVLGADPADSPLEVSASE